MALDLVVRNGVIVDGSGGEPYRGDVAIADGIITEIGVVDGHGRQEIDADGHVVAPGFIDGHTHMDAQVFWDPEGTSSCWHGVTTVVMGNCGFTLAPVRAEGRELVVRNLERAEDLSPQALAAGIDWCWETFPEYLDAIDQLPKAINIAANVGHSALRTWAMGERAFDGPATEDDLRLMRGELGASLAAGAIGFTTSRSRNHETSDDRPVASRAASWAEVCQLVGMLTPTGNAVFELAVEPDMGSPDPSVRAASARRLGALAVSSGVPVTFGVAAPHPQSQTLLDLARDTTAAGARMFGQSHSRGISVVLSFRGHLPFDSLPEWTTFRAQPIDEQIRGLADPHVRSQLRDAAVHGNYVKGLGAEVPPPDYDRMQILYNAVPPNPTVAAVAAEQGVHPVDVMIDLALASNFDQLFVQPLTSLEPADLLEIMRHPNSVMTFSDSGAHVSQISDASIQTHLFAHWVRREQAFSVAEAVKMVSATPAQAWGFTDRGQLRTGYRGDLNIFDPDRIAPELPTLVHDLPANAPRLRQRSVGFLATIVAGQVVIRDGEHTGARPGQLIRRRNVPR
jgi:N-acyl-D-amino-acid deacylase